MKAQDIMVAPVITAKPQSSIKEVAQTLVEKRISALPSSIVTAGWLVW